MPLGFDRSTSFILARAALLPLLCASCASNKLVAIATIDASDQLRCTIDFPRGDEADGELLRRALDEAAPKLARWMGPLSTKESLLAPIAIHLLPDHAALEAAVDQRGFPWLRAWSFAREIYLQTPHSWSEAAQLSRDSRFDLVQASQAVQSKVAELLAHELTHALMYQLIQGGRRDGPIVEPPLWFREGMASVTAGQEKSRMDAFQLARFLLASPGADLLSASPELLRDAKDAVYGAAHRAFELLERSCGDSAAISILLAMRDGTSFEDAFTAATGRRLADFLVTFVQAQLDPSSDPALCRTR